MISASRVEEAHDEQQREPDRQRQSGHRLRGDAEQ
jgi:hypothetical protein